eukprot:UN1424
MVSRLTDRRFLSCVGVHVCIAVFAWAPCKVPIAFAAHIPQEALKHGLDNGRRSLPEVGSAMRETFANCSHVQAHIVGGHRALDRPGPLRQYFGDSERQQVSWHVREMVREAGFSNVNTDMLLPFEGIPGCAGHNLLSRENKRFTIAALDLRTGKVVTHSLSPGGRAEYSFGDRWPGVHRELEREKVDCLQLPTGRMIDGRGSDHAHLALSRHLPSR